LRNTKSSISPQAVLLKRSYVRAAPAHPLVRIAVSTISPRTNVKAADSSILVQDELLEEVKRVLVSRRLLRVAVKVSPGLSGQWLIVPNSL